VLVERTLTEVAGTLLTAELALEYGLACNTAGGTHTRLSPPYYGNDWCLLEKTAGGGNSLVVLATFCPHIGARWHDGSLTSLSFDVKECLE
jgi:hypothetical protein